MHSFLEHVDIKIVHLKLLNWAYDISWIIQGFYFKRVFYSEIVTDWMKLQKLGIILNFIFLFATQHPGKIVKHLPYKNLPMPYQVCKNIPTESQNSFIQ